MEAEIQHNGMVVKLSGTPEEVAAAIKALSKVPTTGTIPYIPVVAPVEPVVIPVIQYPDLVGCTCPQPGSAEFGKPWWGVCPRHSTTVCS